MMAQGLILPLIRQNIQPADQIMLWDVNFSTMQSMEAEHGVRCAGNMGELLDGADLVVCAVKPQNLTPAFFQEVHKGTDASSRDAIFLSVIAGKAMQVFEEGGCRKIVRSMPNTPATIGQGMTVWSATPNLTVEERKKVRQVLSSCGKSVRRGESRRLESKSSGVEWWKSKSQSISRFAHSFLCLTQPALSLSLYLSLSMLDHRCTWTTNLTSTWLQVFRAADLHTYSC